MFQVSGTRGSLPRFRWKYAFSAFLVCGVLSITIGKSKDPLLLEVERLQGDYTRIFKINKDPKTATSAELDGPEEKTYPLDSPVLTAFVRDLYSFGQTLSKASFTRSAKYKISDDRLIATAAAAALYEGLVYGVYKNYMRLAHDSRFKTYRTTSVFREAFEFVFLGANAAVKRDLERWKLLNHDELAAAGARAFSPTAYDYLNIRLDPKTAQVIYANPEGYKRIFNIRNVKDEEGHYTQVELFLNAFEKQLAEYAAISNPKSKEEYLKLLQFAAIREGITNRWAIRRLRGESAAPSLPNTKSVAVADRTRVSTKLPFRYERETEAPPAEINRFPGPIGLADSTINACAPDLVSFRTKKKGTVNDLESYSSLWQEDRHGDLMALGAEAAAEATKGVPLLSDLQYAEVFGTYVGAYKGFQTDFLTRFGDDTQEMLRELAAAYSPTIRANEELKWSSDRLEKTDIAHNEPAQPNLPTSVEKFFLASFPADDLSIEAVAERYADQAYMLRLYYMAEGLQMAAANDMIQKPDPYGMGAGTKVQFFPEASLPESKVRAAEVAKAYMAPRAAAWKKALAARIVRALQTKLGMSVPTANGNLAGLGYLRGKGQDRYDAYAKDLMPIAAIGARGIQVRRVSEAAERELHKKMLSERECSNAPTLAGVSVQTSCVLKYPDPRKISAKEIKSPGWYLGFAPFRNPANLFGVKEIILPETPDELSQFFKKKLNAVLSYDNEITQYEEPKIAAKIARNEVVMRGMDHFFGTLAGEVEERSKSAGAGELNPSCSMGNVSIGKHGTPRKNRRHSSESRTPLAPEACSLPTNDEAEGRRRVLEAAIIPAAKKAYAEFLKEISTVATYKDPARAAKKLAEEQAERVKQFRAFKPTVAAQDKLSIRNVNPGVAKLMEGEAKKVSSTAQRSEELKRRWGYFRPGRDRSLDKTGGELYLKTEAEKREAIALYKEALGMLGIAEETTDAVIAIRNAPNDPLPTRVSSWVTTEHLLKNKLGKARLLERMVATVSDQIAMGQVFEQEAISRGPILTLQDAWKWKKNEKQSPILIERLAQIWSSEKGWGDGTGYRVLFRSTLDRAAQNDIGKVETFCKADIKKYRDDENFRTMFLAITGIRDMLGTEEAMRNWDAQILKESRSWEQAFMEDFIDPYSMPMMIAIGVVMLFQLVSAFFTGGATLISSPFFLGVARFIFLQMTGNLGIVTLIFSFQTYLMVSTYHFKMPPQMGFTFQVANSRIQNMQEGRFVGGAVVDREKMNNLREELNNQQFMTNVGVIGEIAQFGVFTLPGVKSTLGLAGRKSLHRLASASSPEVLAAVQTKTLAELIRDKGFSAGVKEYWSKAGPALKNLRRVAVVQAGKTVKQEMAVAGGLRQALGDKIGSLFKGKEEVRKALEFIRDNKLRESKAVFGARDDAMAEILAKEIDKQTLKFDAIKAEVEAKTPEIRAYVAKAGGAIDQQESLIVVLAKQYEDELISQGSKNLSWSERRLETRALALASTAETFVKESRDIDRLLADLDKAAATPSRTEVQSYFANLSPSDLEMHRNYFKQARDLIDRDTMKGIKRAFKDHEYLQEDWKDVSPDAKAISEFYRTGKAHIFINTQGEIGLFDPKEFAANPEKFSVNTLQLWKAYPKLLQYRNTRDEAVRKLKSSLQKNVPSP